MNKSRMAIEHEQKFFSIVQTTPDYVEANDLLREAMAVVREEIAKAQGMCTAKGNELTIMLSALKQRLQAELHRIETIRTSATMKQAIKEIFGDDGYDQCVQWIKAHGGYVI